MKKLLALSLLFSFGAQAGTLRAIYKNESAPTEMKYVGLFKNKLSSAEYLVTFGKGMNFRVYNVGMFVTYPGGTSHGNDESTVLVTKGIEREKTIEVSLNDLNKKSLFKGNYELYNSPASKQFALNIDKAVEAQFDKYRKMTNPKTPAEVRGMFRQLDLDLYSYDGFDAKSAEFEFPTFDLQIEFYLYEKAPSAALASAKITSTGSDAISKSVLEGKNKWFKNADEAQLELISLLESGESQEDKVFASYSTKVQYAGLSARLKNAIQKHLKYEILKEKGFECEDSFYNWTSATWILKDGSTVSYSPGTECD